EASGSVHNPGKHQLPSGSRLSRLALTAAPTADAYLLGAALLRKPQRLEQTRLKAGLMFDLEQLESTATSKSAVAVSIQQLLRWIDSLPVTGRVAHPLESRVLEATRAYDLPVQAGDHLFYPARPTTITISGAVSQQCTLAHIALQAPIVYLQHCRKTVGASPMAIQKGLASHCGIVDQHRAWPRARSSLSLLQRRLCVRRPPISTRMPSASSPPSFWLRQEQTCESLTPTIADPDQRQLAVPVHQR
ncbi:MAG: capsule biosynthesis GfcC D2 domain-containing protein, partial [Stenotrophomonas sp.]